MSYSNLLLDLPESARVWVFAAEHGLNHAQQEAFLGDIESFIPTWTSHRQRVRGAAALLADRFLVVAATMAGEISGCGIDSMVRAVQRGAERSGVELASPLRVFWRTADGTVESLPRGAFRKLVRSGVVGPETHVFDLTVPALSNMRNGEFEKPMRASWHARVFRIPVEAP